MTDGDRELEEERRREEGRERERGEGVGGGEGGNAQAVGRQVWRGSLLLADYLLHHHSEVYRYAYLWVLLQ